MTEEKSAAGRDFIREIIDGHNQSGRFDGRVQTRFPPEPNGFLHIGHAKAICISYGIAEEYGGKYNLRFDDTNPAKEKTEFVDAIKDDIRWLGFDWEDREFYASDYFETLYDWACQLIEQGDAYVCDLDEEEIRSYRGTAEVGPDGKRTTPPGKNSPFRDRSPEENLELFRAMREGKFEDGSKTLRAKIDMAHPNLNMRDPVMYRIQRTHHHRTGDAWCLYPTYDWTHGQSDSLEGITHSICDVGFENHRPLYDWYLDKLGVHHPQQIEFGRLNLSYTMMSKRYLRQMVEEGTVDGWDDPRMPTLCGMRRRGYTPESIRGFCKRIGITKNDSKVESELLEHCLREDLNARAHRVMVVQDPLKVVITNYPEGKVEEMEAVNNPEDEEAGTRQVPFARTIYIERDDFMEDPPKKFFRLGPSREVRLRYAYLATCTDVIKDDQGQVVEVHCEIDLESKGGNAPDGRRVRGTIHWVSAEHAVDMEVRLYDRLFTKENPLKIKKRDQTFMDFLNADSKTVLEGCKGEPMLGEVKPGFNCQFERLGYYCCDKDSDASTVVFNRAVSLKDSWSRQKG